MQRAASMPPANVAAANTRKLIQAGSPCASPAIRSAFHVTPMQTNWNR